MVSNILPRDHRLSEGEDGYQLEASYLVTATGHESQDAALYDILTDPNIPTRGAAHPVIPGIQLIERSVEPIDGDNGHFRVKLRYGIPSDALDTTASISTGSGTHTDQIDIDLTGQPIQTSMEVAAELPDGGMVTRTDIQVHNVDVERPSTSVEFERVENQNPTQKSMSYVGKVNATPWYYGGAGTWLCTGIQGDSEDGGKTYKVRYSFQYNPAGWNPVVRHRDPQTGLPAFFSPFQAAVITPPVYTSANFGSLGLSSGLHT